MSDSGLQQTIARWRARAEVVQRANREYADDEAAAVTKCADELEAILAERPPPRNESACINCGEAHDGGYTSGWEGHINEGAVGPFCSQCWEFLRETFCPPKPKTERPPPQDAPNWQPIDTAPKDGTHVVLFGTLWNDPAQRPRACVSWYCRSRDESPAHALGWFFSAPGYTNGFNPTHWANQPLGSPTP